MSINWEIELLEYLIQGSTVGRKWTDIVKRFNHYATSEMLEQTLDDLHLTDKVQKFRVRQARNGKGRPVTVWRATTKALDV